jgi:hypothetical protein
MICPYSLHQIPTVDDGLVSSVAATLHASDRLYERVHVRVKKERTGITFPAGAIQDPVWCGNESTIAPAVQYVTHIHDECPGPGGRIDPVALRVPDLQTTSVVL